MKAYIIVILVGILAIGGFFAWQSNSLKEAPTPAETPTITEQQPAPAPAKVVEAPTPPPAPPSSNSPLTTRPKIEKEAPEQRLLIVGKDTITRNGRTFDPSAFHDRVPYGDIPAAISKFQNETDPDMKIAYLGDLASQPAKSAEIHAIFIQSLQSESQDIQDAAFEAALNYEDETIIPALKKLMETPASRVDKRQLADLIELLEAEPYRNVYHDSKNKK